MKLLRAWHAVRHEFAVRPGRIYISGTGRAGTTFLVQLLTRLGLDTGFNGASTTDVYFPTARAGFEKDIFDPNGPHVVKSPFLCDHVDAVLATGIEISHVLIPVRDFDEAAASRRHVQSETTGYENGAAVPGGLWGTELADDQATVIGMKFGRLIEALVRNEIPMTFLAFPRFAKDADYLYDRLCFMLPGVNRRRFGEVFAAEARPDLIHDFSGSRVSGSRVL